MGKARGLFFVSVLIIIAVVVLVEIAFDQVMLIEFLEPIGPLGIPVSLAHRKSSPTNLERLVGTFCQRCRRIAFALRLALN